MSLTTFNRVKNYLLYSVLSLTTFKLIKSIWQSIWQSKNSSLGGAYFFCTKKLNIFVANS